MNLIQQLTGDLHPGHAPVFVGIKTTSGDIRIGTVEHAGDEVLVLAPAGDPDDGEGETSLVITTYFNVNNIVSAWLHV